MDDDELKPVNLGDDDDAVIDDGFDEEVLAVSGKPGKPRPVGDDDTVPFSDIEEEEDEHLPEDDFNDTYLI